MMNNVTSDESMSGKTILAIAAMGLAVVIIANDFTAFSVALPAMEKEFHADVSDVQWVINAYALVFGVSIVTGGRLADMFGRRRIFFIGTAIFSAFSLAAGVAPNLATLIVARGLMGIGGAMMWPAILGMMYELLPASKAGLAGGVILAAAGFGNALGPLIGGFLTDALSWRWIFFVNLPIAALGVLATWRFVDPDAGVMSRRKVDYSGIVTLSLGLVALLLALDTSSDWGWTSGRVIGLILLAVASLGAFGIVERRSGADALIPPDVVKNRDFVAPCASVLLISAVFFAVLLYIPQFMVVSLHYSPLRAGAGLLPMMVIFAIVSFAAGPLYERVGAKSLVTAGAACITAGIFQLSFISSADGYVSLLPGLVVLGVGIGLFYSSVTTAGVTALDASRASLAGGIVYMCQVAGGAVGLGINTAIVSSAQSSVSEFVGGIGNAFTLDAILAFLATIVALVFVRSHRSQQLLAIS
jgi:EmrB/QacA subfamily drug resistance transporter